jgi:hypothetical protein
MIRESPAPVTQMQPVVPSRDSRRYGFDARRGFSTPLWILTIP